MKKLFFISLLMMSSLVVATRETPLEKFRDKLSYTRMDEFKNGKPSQNELVVTGEVALKLAEGLGTIGLCTYGVDFILNSFDLTKNLPSKEAVAFVACSKLYADFYYELSFIERQKARMQKVQEEKEKKSSSLS